MTDDGCVRSDSMPQPTWSVNRALLWAQERLSGTTEAALAAKMLLAHVLECTVSELFMHPDRLLSVEQISAYRSLVARRARHEPVAYLIGHRGFLDLDLAVDRRVLVPRPETEVLVEQALEIARRWARPRIADVGTGSGAIAVSLAVHLPDASVYALDCSAGALEVARQNAERNDVTKRMTFLQGDLVTPLPVSAHLIVANLPYVTEDEYAALAPDIRLYEPREALVAGRDGLDAIRGLLSFVSSVRRSYLTEDGVLLLEIGAGQGEDVSALAARAFPGAQVSVLPDYAGRDRVVRIEPGKSKIRPV
jgi:release factor glutamine methyltransferase